MALSQLDYELIINVCAHAIREVDKWGSSHRRAVTDALVKALSHLELALAQSVPMFDSPRQFHGSCNSGCRSHVYFGLRPRISEGRAPGKVSSRLWQI